MRATINGRLYRIEFSYRRRAGKKATLARNSPIEGLSSCAIVCDGYADGFNAADSPRFVSVGSAVCSSSDNWSRTIGRAAAFVEAIRQCGILRNEKEAFARWFLERWPEPVKPAPKPRFKPSEEEIELTRKVKRALKESREYFDRESETHPDDLCRCGNKRSQHNGPQSMPELHCSGFHRAGKQSLAQGRRLPDAAGKSE
jgi:hypothetical protein